MTADLWRCAGCGGGLSRTAGSSLDCVACGRAYPIVAGIPRFAASSGPGRAYDVTFSRASNLQLDSGNGTGVARRRLEFLIPELCEPAKAVTILQAGCGAGRYTEPALRDHVDLWAIDLSASAVESCRRNIDDGPRLHLAQADIYELPFAPASFDVIYSLGVLMAVPSPARALQGLTRLLKPGGRLVVDIYRHRTRQLLDARRWLRPLTSRLPPDTLWRGLERAVPLLWPISRAIGRAPLVGRQLRYIVPICNYEGLLSLNDAQHRLFSLVDTFDFLAATYSHRARPGEFRRWIEAAGLVDVQIDNAGMMTAAARRPRPA